jgi:hypothetical protein
MLGSRSFYLTDNRSIGDVANACREALAELLVLEDEGIERWLAGSYRRALILPSRQSSPAFPGHSTLPPPSLFEAKRYIRESIALAQRPGSDEFIASLPATLPIARVHDAFGGSGAAPIDMAGATLVTRGISLVVAAYLCRPEDFLLEDLLEPKVRISGVRSKDGVVDEGNVKQGT